MPATSECHLTETTFRCDGSIQRDIVIMDNLDIHKMLVVREAILDAGAIPLYLPTYPGDQPDRAALGRYETSASHPRPQRARRAP